MALETVRSEGKKGDSLYQRGARLKLIEMNIGWIVSDCMIDCAVIESPSFGSKFGSPHDRSGLWWAVVHDLIERGIPVAQVSPQGRAKYGTGKGNSAKADVYAAVKSNYASVLPRPLKNNDEGDAVLLAAIGARDLGMPVEAVSPSDRSLEALAGVDWPADWPGKA